MFPNFLFTKATLLEHLSCLSYLRDKRLLHVILKLYFGLNPKLKENSMQFFLIGILFDATYTLPKLGPK